MKYSPVLLLAGGTSTFMPRALPEKAAKNTVSGFPLLSLTVRLPVQGTNNIQSRKQLRTA